MNWQAIDGKTFPTNYEDTLRRLEARVLLRWFDGKEVRYVVGVHVKYASRRGVKKREPFFMATCYREEHFTHFCEIVEPE